MNCDELAGLIDAYVDGELTASQCAAVAQHLPGCPACLRAVTAREALRSRIRAAGGYTPPAGLAQQVSRSMTDVTEARGGVATSARHPWWLAGTHAAAATAGALALFLWLSPAVPQKAALDDVLTAHLRGLAAEQFGPVASSQTHTVRPWFAGKIDFAPPVADLSPAGFPLIGGRVDYVAGRPAAALTYTRRLHRITLFILPAAAASGGTALASQSGYQLVHWQDATFGYWAVSDLNRAELAEFGERFRSAIAPPPAAAP